MSAHAEPVGHAHADGHDHHGPPAANKSSRVHASLLGMLLFIASEIMLFGSFFTAYFFVRVVEGFDWPPEGFELPRYVVHRWVRMRHPDSRDRPVRSAGIDRTPVGQPGNREPRDPRQHAAKSGD